VTSRSSKSSYSETRIRISYPCGTFTHTISCNILSEKQLIPLLRTLGEEAFGETGLRQKLHTFHDVSNCHLCFQHAAQNRLTRVGGVHLAGLDRISFVATTTDNKSRLKLSSRTSQIFYRLVPIATVHTNTGSVRVALHLETRAVLCTVLLSSL